MNERILKVIDYLDISISEFERSCNLSNGAVSKMGDNTRRSTLNKICDTYPQLNIDWLLTGKGDMVKEYTVASLRDRILEYCDFKKMTINEFQAKAGLDKYLFDDSSKAINSHIIKKILYYHPDLNREWLLTGEGEMLKGGKSDNTVSISGNDIKEGDFSGTLVYDIDATCGTDCRDILFAQDDIIGSVNLPGIRKDSVIIRANGDSMEPRVCDGNLVVIRQIYSWEDIF